MLNSPILEVAIGMIFFYLLLSLICTSLNEIIEAWLKNRARDLESGIRRLLDDESATSNNFIQHVGDKVLRLCKMLFRRPMPAAITGTTGLASQLYNHALVRGLYLDGKQLPSYIPSRNFALALMDLVAPAGAKGATPSAPAPVPNPVVVIAGGPQAAAEQVLALQPAAQPNPGDLAIQSLRNGINDPSRVSSAKVRSALLALIDAAGGDPAKVRENLENWYNSSMDRVAGWYKRRTQTIILVLGVLVAIMLNADTVLVVDALWHNSALRTGVVAAAEEMNTGHRNVTNTKSQASELPAGQSTTATLQSPDKPDAPSGDAARNDLDRNKSKLVNLGLPIGWNNQDDAHQLPSWPARGNGESWWHYWTIDFPKNFVPVLKWSLYQLDLHWLGWLITGVAISLGSPFWFDLLNKFIVVRSTVKPQEKSPDESSKA